MVQSNGKDFMKTKGAGNFARKKSQSKCIEMYEAQPTWAKSVNFFILMFLLEWLDFAYKIWPSNGKCEHTLGMTS